jgi:hypothetical protein
MDVDIRYKGLSLAPGEQTVDNGALSLCAGVELKYGGLHPSVVNGTDIANPLKITDGTIAKLVYVHQTSIYTNFIAICNNTLYWFKEDGSFGGSLFSISGTLNSVSSVGNTIIVISSEGINYLLHKDNSYLYLGSKPPFIKLSFNVSTTYRGNYDTSTLDVKQVDPTSRFAWRQSDLKASDVSTVDNKAKTVTFKKENQSDITDCAWALLNSANNIVAKQGHFYAPFYVRYCYRMYDGTTMYLHSAPIFIPVCDNMKVYLSNATISKDTNNIEISDSFDVSFPEETQADNATVTVNKLCMMYQPCNVALRYMLLNSDILAEIKDRWSDIIKSVDIFISSPITRLDSSQMIKSAKLDDKLGFRYITNYLEYNMQHYDLHGDVMFDIPGLSNEVYIDKIANISNFYLLHSFKIDKDFATSYTEIPYDKTVVEYITTQEQMIDDYKSHNNLFPASDKSGVYIYNHRASLYGMKEQLFEGFQVQSMLPNITGYNGATGDKVMESYKVIVVLKTENGDKAVSVDDATQTSEWCLRNLPMFYPDSRATKMYIFAGGVTGGGTEYIELEMKQCRELNGAMTIGNFSFSYNNKVLTSLSTAVDSIVDLSNKIYTSEVDNPYYFPLKGINTIGVGSIIGMAATTRALSQGQFGQYPLMVFSTDGIWALNISSEGMYISPHNLNREVALNSKTITQLDQTVIYSTARAIKNISESSVGSLSDVLDGPYLDLSTMMPVLASYFISGVTDTTKEIEYKTKIKRLIAFNKSPISYIRESRVIYDYKKARLLFFGDTSTDDVTADSQVVFVYSISDKAWSTTLTKLAIAEINSNPYPYIQWSNGVVSRLDKDYAYEESTITPALIISRTLKFGSLMNGISGFDQLHSSKEKQLLFFFGSNDNINWRYIGKSTQLHADYLPEHSFRYFRIAIYLKLSEMEEYTFTRLNVNARYDKF